MDQCTPTNNDNILPLAGIHVLDLTQLLPGAFCALILADLGADVIKVEAPDGDPMRDMAPAGFQALNRNKRSVIINLKDDAGPRQLLAMAGEADVLIESFRPGVMARLGVGVDVLRAANPALIMCSLSGYGQTGPRAQQAGHDLNYMALAGLLAGVEQPPVVQMADLGGGWSAVCAILAALFRRQTTGEGAYIDACLLDGALSAGILLRAAASQRQAAPDLPNEVLSGGLACYHIYRTADGKAMALGALEPRFFAAFCHLVNRPELIDAQYELPRQSWLREELASLFALKTRDEWVELISESGVDACCTPVLDMFEAAHDPGVKARGMWLDGPDGVAHTRPGPLLADAAPPVVSPAPVLAETSAQAGFRSLWSADDCRG